MSTIVVKNLPDHLHALLKQRAEHNHRSMTKEVLHLIEAGLHSSPTPRSLPSPVALRSATDISSAEFETHVAAGQR